MASRVQNTMFWETFKNAKSVILRFFPVAVIGEKIHILYVSYPQQIYSQFVQWEYKVLSPYNPQWSVYFSVSLLLITRKHPVYQDTTRTTFCWHYHVFVFFKYSIDTFFGKYLNRFKTNKNTVYKNLSTVSCSDVFLV